MTTAHLIRPSKFIWQRLQTEFTGYTSFDQLQDCLGLPRNKLWHSKTPVPSSGCALGTMHRSIDDSSCSRLDIQDGNIAFTVAEGSEGAELQQER